VLQGRDSCLSRCANISHLGIELLASWPSGLCLAERPPAACRPWPATDQQPNRRESRLSHLVSGPVAGCQSIPFRGPDLPGFAGSPEEASHASPPVCKPTTQRVGVIHPTRRAKARSFRSWWLFSGVLFFAFGALTGPICAAMALCIDPHTFSHGATNQSGHIPCRKSHLPAINDLPLHEAMGLGASASQY
jgi:hypothetical protein